MGHDQGGHLQLLDDRGNGECLAGSGRAQQHLILHSLADAVHKLNDGFRLVAGWLKWSLKFKRHLLLTLCKNVRSIILPYEQPQDPFAHPFLGILWL